MFQTRYLYQPKASKKIHGLSIVSINILAVLICLLGIGALNFLSVRVNPSPRTASLIVSYNYTNRPPIAVEQEITSKLEASFAKLDRVIKVSSKSLSGRGYIKVTFDEKYNFDEAKFDIATIIRQTHPNLPKQSSYPQISASNNIEEEPLLLSISYPSNQNLNRLNKYINNSLVPQIRRLHGVGKIDIGGILHSEVDVIYDQKRMQQLGVSKEKTLNSIKTYFKKHRIGAVKANGIYQSVVKESPPVQELGNLPIQITNNKIITLNNFAEIRTNNSLSKNIFRVNGNQSTTISIHAALAANQIELSKKINELIFQKSAETNNNFQPIIIYDASVALSKELKNIVKLSLTSVAIVLIIIFSIYRNRKYITIISIALLTNMLFTLLLIYLLNIQLHIYSIAGFTISIGIIVDNFIVSISHYEKFKDHRISRAIFAAGLTTIAPLLIIVLAGEQYRQYLLDFALIFCISLVSSFLISLTLIPGLLLTINKSSLDKTPKLPAFYKFYYKYINYCSKYKIVVIATLIITFGLPIFLLPDKANQYIPREFHDDYNKTIGSEYFINNIKDKITTVFGGALRLFYENKKDYYNHKFEKDINLQWLLEFDEGITINSIDQSLKMIEKELKGTSGINYFIVKSDGNQKATIEVIIPNKFRNTRIPETIKGTLSNLANSFGHFESSIAGFSQPFANKVSNTYLNQSIEVYGPGPIQLRQQAELLSQKLKKSKIITSVILSDERSFTDSEQNFSLYNINLENLTQPAHKRNILNLIRSMGVEEKSKYYGEDKNKTVEINVFAKKDISSFWKLTNQPILVDSTTSFKLTNHLVNLPEKKILNITKIDQTYRIIVDFNYNDNPSNSKQFVTSFINEANLSLPTGFYCESSLYDTKNKDDKSIQMFYLIIGSLFVILMTCVILFNSLNIGLSIFAMIPPSFCGIFISPIFFEYNFDYGGYTSFLIVAGLTVNSGIFILNNIKQYKYKITNPSDLYILSFKDKIYPITISIISTIIALLPFALSQEDIPFWKSLSICTCFGLISSWFSVILILPLLVKIK